MQKLICWLGLIALLACGAADAQPIVLDCSCLSTQAILFTNTCCGVIPDLCPVAANCYLPSVVPAPGFFCSQFPPPGTPVCTSTPITFTLTESNSSAFSTTCNVMYYVGVTTNRFMLLCGPTQVLPCNSTNWIFTPPGWTNTCCTNPITIIGPTIVTNWPTITATWIGIDCNGVGDTCTETVLFQQPSGLPCKCLNIICPSNIVVQTCLGIPGTTSFGFTNIFYPPPVVSNSCIGVITNVTYSPPSGSPFPVGTNTVVGTVYDNLGNVASCAFDVIVLGNTTPPTVVCGPNQTVQCGSTWSPIPPTAFSACCTNFTIQLFGGVTNTISPCSQTIEFWWHVMDCNNNFANCTNTVTVIDTTPPVINCVSNQTYQCGGTAGGTGWTPVPPTATDNCCLAVTVTLVSAVTNTLSTCNETITLVWKATDCCTNSSFCTEVINIVDTTPPVLNCQPFRQIECGSGPNWFGDYPVAFDACCGTNVTITLANVITNVQTTCLSRYTLFWTATDCCTNTSGPCIQQLQIVDTKPPNVICATNKIVQCGSAWTFNPPVAVDDCCTNPPTVIITGTATNALANCTIAVTRNWQITDCCGNSTNCSQTVSIVDTTPPVITCGANQTVQCGTTWNFIPPTAIDACCGTNVFISRVLTATNLIGACSESISVLWQATDCCGNKSFCTNFVTVVDTLPPVITCNSNQSYQCGSTAGGGGLPIWPPIPPVAIDACCGTNVTVTLLSAVTNGSIPCNATITLNWKATDCCTNSSFCTEVLTITDTNPPIIICGTNKLVECGTAWTFDQPTAFDACCGTNVTITVLSNITVFTSTCVSVYERFWMATDCCTNNSTVCSQRVTVQDTTPPVANCASNFTVNCGTAWSFSPPTAIDACCGTNVTISVLGTVTNSPNLCPIIVTRTWNIVDCCGNAVQCSQTVTIVDNVPPVITCGANQTVQCGTPWAFNKPTATDNCCPASGITIAPVSVTTNNIAPCQQLITVIWKATDCCGNSSFCTNSVSVVDTIPPVIACRTNYIWQCGSPLVPPTATDLCCPTPTVTILNATTNVINNCTRVLTINWQAVDCCTNTSTCVEVITNTDTTPPVITCAPNKTIQCGTIISFDPPTAFDACCGNNVTITVLNTTPLFGTTCVQTTTRTWQATDCCGNSSTCSQTITVVDTTPPVITCSPSFSVPAGTPWNFTPPTAIDACCANVTIVVMATTTNITGPCQITYTRTWKAVDCCGNSSPTCSQSITTSTTPPPNDLCPNAIPITVNAPYICGYTVCATPSAGGTLTPVPCGASATTPDVWYTVTAICTAPMTVDTCQPCAPHPTFDTVLSAYNNNCAALVQVPAAWPYYSCNDDTGGACGLRSTIYFQAVAGQTYRIRVSGFAGATGWFSIRATQSTAPPINDLCSGAIAVTVGNPAACGSTLCGATPTPPGNLFPTPCGSSANTPDVWYKFTPQCSGVVTMNTCGTCPPAGNFDTVLSVYTGTCPGPLNQVAGGCNDDAGPNGPCPWTLQSFVQFNATAGVTYYIRVSGWAGSTGDFRLNINQTSTPPVNDLCANATVVNAGSYPWNNCGANTDGPGNPCGLQKDVWFSYTPLCSGTIMVNTCLSGFDTVMAVYTGPCNALSLVGCNDNATSGSCNGSQQSYLTFNGVAGTTYHIRLGGFGGATGGGILNIVGPSPLAVPTCGSGPVSCHWFMVIGSGVGTPWAWSASSPCCSNLRNLNVPGVVGSASTLAAAFAASINGQCPGMATSVGPFLAICTRCGPGAPLLLQVGPAGTSPLNMCVVSGFNLPTTGPCSFNPDIVEVELSGHDANNNGIDDYIDIASGSSADANGNLIPDEAESCFGPQITAKPNSQLVALGQDAVLHVAVSGTAPFSYQWLFNGVPLPGANSSTLQISPVEATNLGAYSVTVSNDCGVVEGTAADILVEPTYLPVITNENLADGWFRFMVETKIGFDYVIEYKNDLNDPAWSTLSTVPGTGAPQLIYDSAPPPHMRYYRVRQQSQSGM